MSRVPRIMIVDNDPAIGLMLDELVADAGYRPYLCCDDRATFELVRQSEPDLLIRDLWLRYRADGWCILELFWRDPPTAQIPVVAGSSDTAMLAARARELRARHCAVLEKPSDVPDLLALIRMQLERTG